MKAQEGTEIYKQRLPGAYYYVVDQGEVELLAGSSVVKTLVRGDGFGEMALLHHSPRQATAVAKTDVGLWALSRHNFKQVS